MRLFLIAGEASGDLLGAGLIRELRKLQPGVQITGIGGRMMEAEGLVSLFPMSDLSVMGLTEIVPHAPRLLRRIRETVAAIAAGAPEALVTIDSPGFCLRVARKARAARPGLRVVHYVAPSVWAWRPGRARHMAAFVDHVLALLPFEPELMRAAGMSCDFVGHPVAALPVAGKKDVADFRGEFGIEPGQRLLTVLPGSRHGELDRLLPVFGEVVARLKADDPGLVVAIPAAPGMAGRLNEYLGSEERVKILDPDGLDVVTAEGRKRACFAASDAALAASGTVSLELAAQGLPMVVAYRASWLTELMVRRMALIDTVCLVNIVTGTRAVPEFLFGNCRADGIAPAVAGLLGGDRSQVPVMARCMELLGRGGEPPDLRAAKSVLTAVGQ